MTYARGWAADSVNTRVRLKAELDQANQDNALLREEMRIKDARMAQLDRHRRPHYPPTERLAILELKAARGWSLEQTAKAFLVTAATVASWLRRVDEQGPNALLQLRTPVNRFPNADEKRRATGTFNSDMMSAEPRFFDTFLGGRLTRPRLTTTLSFVRLPLWGPGGIEVVDRHVAARWQAHYEIGHAILTVKIGRRTRS